MVSSRSNSIRSAPDPGQKYVTAARRGKILKLLSWYERVQITELNANMTEITPKKAGSCTKSV